MKEKVLYPVLVFIGFLVSYDLFSVEAGEYYIQNEESTLYLAVSEASGGKEIQTVDFSSDKLITWELVATGEEGKYFIKLSGHELYVIPEERTPGAGKKLILWHDHPPAWNLEQLENHRFVISDQTILDRSLSWTPSARSSAPETSIIEWPFEDAKSSTWNLVPFAKNRSDTALGVAEATVGTYFEKEILYKDTLGGKIAVVDVTFSGISSYDLDNGKAIPNIPVFHKYNRESDSDWLVSLNIGSDFKDNL